jgi:hypothetical protein
VGKETRAYGSGTTDSDFFFVVGAVKDISFLIDILPAFLFPHGERTIEEWALAGFSLGGHATWLVLQHGARNCSYRAIFHPTHSLTHEHTTKNQSINPKNRESASASRSAAAPTTLR